MQSLSKLPHKNMVGVDIPFAMPVRENAKVL